MNNQILPIITNSDGTIYKVQAYDKIVTAPQIYTILERVEIDVPVVTDEAASNFIWRSIERPPVEFGSDCFSFEFKTAKFLHIYVNHLSHKDLTVDNINAGDGTKENPFTNIAASLHHTYCVGQFLRNACQQENIGLYITVSGVYDQPYVVLFDIYSQLAGGRFVTGSDMPIVMDFKDCACNIDCREFDFSYIGANWILPEKTSVYNMKSTIIPANKSVYLRQGFISDCTFELQQAENDLSNIFIYANLILNSSVTALHGSIESNAYNSSFTFNGKSPIGCAGNWRRCTLTVYRTGYNNVRLNFYEGTAQADANLAGSFLNSNIKTGCIYNDCFCCNCNIDTSSISDFWHGYANKVTITHTGTRPVGLGYFVHSSYNEITVEQDITFDYTGGHYYYTPVGVFANSGLCVGNNISIQLKLQITVNTPTYFVFAPFTCISSSPDAGDEDAVLKDWVINVSVDISGDYVVGYTGSTEPVRDDCGVSLINFNVTMPDCVTGPYWDEFRAKYSIKETDFCVWVASQI